VAIDLDGIEVECTAHDVPHDHFHALGPRFAHVFGMRNPRERLGILGQFVEKGRVEGSVDQSCAFTLQLVRHAAGTIYHHTQRVGVGIDRAANRLAELEAPSTGRRGILHDIDAERNDLEGPRRGSSARHGQRHSEPMIHGHLVGNGHVEFLEN
jgi:hypothetical protein